MNETRNPKHFCAEPVPATLASFRWWRLRQTFATPELAEHARLVENDLAMLPKVAHLKSLVSDIKQNVDSFAAALRTQLH